jgi:hypothetical protein
VIRVSPDVVVLIYCQTVFSVAEAVADRIMAAGLIYPVPCDYLPRKSYPYFRARSIFDELANGSTTHGI